MQDEELRHSYHEHRYDSERLTELLQKMDAVQLVIFGKWTDLTTGDITLEAQLAEYDKSGQIYDHGLKRFREPTKVESGESPMDYEYQRPDRSKRPKILDADQVIEALTDCAYVHAVQKLATG